MKKIEFTPSPLYTLSNVAFAQFFRELLAKINQIDRTEITDANILQFVATLTTFFTAYNKTVAKATSNPVTVEVAEADSNRDWAYRRFSIVLKQETSSPNQDNRQAALAIHALIKPYGRVPSLSLEEETLAIDNIVALLESPEFTPYVQQLNFASMVADIKTANEAFKDKYKVRLDSSIAKVPSDNKQQRMQLTEQYNLLCGYVLVMASLEKDELFDELFSIINTLRETYNAQLNRMAPRKTGETDDPAEA